VDVLVLRHRLPSFGDWEGQYYLALLNVLPTRLLRGCLCKVFHQNITLHNALTILYALQNNHVAVDIVSAPHLDIGAIRGHGDAEGA
jgi:hypothetical protein